MDDEPDEPEHRVGQAILGLTPERSSALLYVLKALKGPDVEEWVKRAATTIGQALVEAELSWVLGVGRTNGPALEPRGAAGTPEDDQHDRW